MKIESLKELTKVIQACRKLGVESIKVDNVEFHLGHLPDKPGKTEITVGMGKYIVPGGITPDTKIITDELTEEQLMFYSARPEAFTRDDQ